MDALTIMKRLGQGRTLEEWGEAIRSLAQEVSETGKPGKLTLSVEVKPLGGQGSPEIGFKETLARTPPKTGERGALLFVYDGDLFTADPRQPQMPHFEMVDGAPVGVQQLPSGRWRAYLRQENGRRHVGVFDDPETAARARDAAALKMRCGFAVLNFPITQAKAAHEMDAHQGEAGA